MDAHQIVYSKNVVEFVTVASEYCSSIENVTKISAEANLQKMQKLIPLLYLKAAMLPKTERLLDEELEKYISELDYNVLHQKWIQLLNEYDNFYEVFDPSIQFGQETVTASISENLLDIYQDLKNFLIAYSIGNEEVMNDALAESVEHFEDFWGQQLVNVFRAVHMLVYSNADFSKKNINEEVQPGKGNPKWLDSFWGTDEETDDV
jgi:molecular chaperone GrpE (heat shock protein)